MIVSSGNTLEIAKFEGALLGSALGDALGWPHEQRARRSSSTAGERLELEAWTKESGGRFQPHTENIEAGAYSDDTQLTIAVIRSRASFGNWWHHFARVELPFWTAYQRGGGGATVRAARLWLKGIAPWEANTADRKKYFEAGGNGVAMRIAPHSLWGATDDNFDDVARNVLADGVSTHGHPVALVGALAFAFSVWTSVRLSRPLRYGELIEIVAAHSADWGKYRSIGDYWETWDQSTSSVDDYQLQWHDAVDDVLKGLEIARTGMATGALALDEETLRQIGCFDKRVSGAGTISACAAIFLASKHASSPLEGVMRAAFASGIDTDTIASMTGTIGGCIAGRDWVERYTPRIQDHKLLIHLAATLHRAGTSRNSRDTKPLDARALDHFYRDVEKGSKIIRLPIGVAARVQGDGGVTSKGENLIISSWRLLSEDGQNFVVKKISKKKVDDTSESVDQPVLPLDAPSRSNPSQAPVYHPPQAARAVGISLLTTDLRVSKSFYHGLLGFRITRETANLVQFNDWLVLRQNGRKPSLGEGSTIYVEVENVGIVYRFLKQKGISRLSDIEHRGGRLSFSCSDPDGRTVEIFQR